jgi:4-amino-4-deoxy-L-arabinose transferase-like glycosyltransferase
MTLFRKILLIILLLLAFTIRFYKIDQIPAGLYHDELDAGYHARSILETGKDYRGSFSPFFTNSFVDPRTPIPVWITAISTLIFQTEELDVRMGSVIVGTINVLLVFILISLWSKNYWRSFFTGLVFATSPWQIQFARINHEGNSTLLILLLALTSFTLSIQKKSPLYLLLSAFFLALTLYTYRTMSLLAPIILITLSVIYWDKIKSFGYKKLLISLFLFIIPAVSFIYATTFAVKDKPRIAQISILQDPTVPIQVQRNRELDSNDAQDFEFGKQATRQSFVFHNKLVSWIEQFTINYFSIFSVDFLFIHGDKNHRHSIENQGMLLYIDIAALGFGLFWFFKNRKDFNNQLILALFFLSPIPSSITQDGASHGARLFVFTLPLLIVIGYGWYALFDWLKKLKFNKLFFSAIFLLWLILFSHYLHNYFTHSYYTSDH